MSSRNLESGVLGHGTHFISIPIYIQIYVKKLVRGSKEDIISEMGRDAENCIKIIMQWIWHISKDVCYECYLLTLGISHMYFCSGQFTTEDRPCVGNHN